jgi:hypothetical protein
MKVEALTTVWGDAYVDQFLNATVKSVAFKENKKAMSDIIWNIFTDEAQFEKIDKFIAPLLPDTEVRFKDLGVIRDRIDYLHSGLIWQIKECLKHKTKMLLLPPDSIFGDKTIKNVITLGKEERSCVVVPHPRAHPSILNEAYESNASLVKAAWKHLHRSWSDAEEGTDRQNSFIGGVSYEKLDDKTFSVKHLLPTPYFCDFTEDDLTFFETQPGIGCIDHVWPSLLVQQNRMKYCGSSDACFVVEITERDKNLPPVQRGAETNKFWRNHPHNLFNQQVACIFRSE